MNRKQDLNNLQNIFNRNSNDLIVVYGDKRAGLLELMKEFCSDKEWFYFDAPDLCTDLVINLFVKELCAKCKAPVYNTNDYEKAVQTFLETSSKKKVIVLDEFTNPLHDNPTYVSFILNLISEKCPKNSILFILMSTNVKWIEHEMNKNLGKLYYEFSSIVYAGQLDLCDITQQKQISDNDLFLYYYCLGKNPIFWEEVNIQTNYKDFIIKNFLDVNGRIFNEGLNILPSSFRQKTIYQSILYYLSNGYNKLNDLHKITGISRSKLIVYINSLCDYKICFKEKYEEIGNPNNITKGTYKISDPFIHFWYRFVFPNISFLKVTNPDKFYKKIISPHLLDYFDNYYREFCIYKLMQDNEKHLLPFNIKDIFLYNDKNKSIDFIIKTHENNIIICACDFKSPHMSYKNYENTLKSANKTGVIYDKIALFSAGGFDQKLSMTSVLNNDLILFDGKGRYTSNLI